MTGSVKAGNFVVTGGLATEFLKANGTLDSNTYLTSFDITTQTDPKYLRSDVADTKTSGNITFNNNIAAVFGNSGSVSLLYGDATITNLQLNSGDFRITDAGTQRFTFGRTSGNFTATGGVSSDYWANGGDTNLTNANNVFTDASIPSNSLVIGSNTTASTNFPSAFGQGLFIKGSTEARDFAFWRNNIDNTPLIYVGNKNASAWTWNALLTDHSSSVDDKYLRSDVADTKTAGNLRMATGVPLYFGDTIQGLLQTNGASELMMNLLNSDFKIRDNNATRFTFGRTSGNLTNTGTIISQGTGNNSFVGKVGIGTTAPESRLHLYELGVDSPTTLILENGDVGINTSDDVHKIEFQSNDASSNGVGVAASIRVNAENAGNLYGLAFNTQNGANRGERMRITGTGNVGIGTSSPSARLHLKNTTGSAVKFLQLETTWSSPSGNKSIEWTDATNTLGRISVDYTSPKASMRFGSLYNSGYQTGDVMTLTADGNVGIGNTTPAYKLDVTGTGRFTSTVTATNFILSSDERLKENIQQVSEYDKVFPSWVTFNLKSEPNQKRYGVIAQELEVSHPEFVRTDEEGMKSVAYIDLLIAKIAELEARLNKAGI